jgi:hypothetical protein
MRKVLGVSEHENPVLRDVATWLEQGGYVLELEVARKVHAASPSNLIQGFHYSDPETGLEREGDVRARFTIGTSGSTLHVLDLVIECKSTTSPWVFFVGHRGLLTTWTPVFQPDDRCPICSEMSFGVERFGYGAGPDAYALAQKRAKNAQDHAYQAVQQVASAVLAHYTEADLPQRHEPNTLMSMAVPTVVTRSPLVTCRLGDDGQIQLRSVERAAVTLLKSNLPSEDCDGLIVQVVTIDYFDQFLAGLLSNLREGFLER